MKTPYGKFIEAIIFIKESSLTNDQRITKLEELEEDIQTMNKWEILKKDEYKILTNALTTLLDLIAEIDYYEQAIQALEYHEGIYMAYNGKAFAHVCGEEKTLFIDYYKPKLEQAKEQFKNFLKEE